MAAQSDTPRTVKRRGILAAAGAVVAGIAAKQTARPVAAASDTNFVATGGSGTAFGTSASGYTTGVGATGTAFGVVGSSGTNGIGVSGSSASGAGVSGSSTSGAGVSGTSDAGHGVVGQTYGPDGQGYVGVYGYGRGSGTAGVLGDCSFGTATATGNAGVQGINAQYGVIGNFINNVPGSIAVWGNNTSTGSAPMGVRGDCTNGIGVYGSTSAAFQYAVCGQVLVDNAFGITGIANGNNCVAFAGGTINPTSFAASFQGHVQVFDGAFDVVGAGNKHAIVPHPDGTHRTIYSIEAPECWVEDFGTGTIVAGKAEVALDKEFAALIYTDEYHVFVTEHGGHNGLHTTAKSGGGFVVEANHELATAKGKSAASVTGTFSWRIVARPKTDAKVERLAKATLAPTIDMSKLPGPPPALPVAPTPAKTPPSTPAPVPRSGSATVVQPASSAPSAAPPVSAQPAVVTPAGGGTAPNPLPAARS